VPEATPAAMVIPSAAPRAAMREVEDRIGSCRPVRRGRAWPAGTCWGRSSGANKDAAKGAMALMAVVLCVWGSGTVVTRGAS
jgi:hypothetical protein